MGIFLSLSNNLKHTAQTLAQNRIVVFFLASNTTEDVQDSITREIRNSTLVKDANLVRPDAAAERFKSTFPDLCEIVDNLEMNPFPPSIEATLAEDKGDAVGISSFIDAQKSRPEIEDIQYNKEWVEKMESLSRLIQAVGLFMGGILILASFFIISNVIKLNVMARQSEVEILRLVGATNSYIRIPFLFEGMVLGLIGAALSLALLFLLILVFPAYLGRSLGILNELIKFRSLTPVQSLGLLTAGAITGSLGSFSSLARFLKT